VIGASHFYGGYRTSIVNDRFNNPNSAIFLNAGYYLMPGGTYLSNDFTVTVWHNLLNSDHYRVFDLGDFNDGSNNNNIILMSGVQAAAYLFIDNTGVNPVRTVIADSNFFILNKWQHLAYTLQGTTLRIYLNGVVVASTTSSCVPKVMARPYCYLGKIGALVDPNPAVGYYDEMRFYDRALNQTEILAVMRI
jgi:hypothetical protein